MDTYYKYSKYFGLKYLKDITLRISSPYTLNDPFEEIINEEVMERLQSIAKPEDMGLSDYKKYFGEDSAKEFLTSRINSLIDGYGIVSFSETPRNLLMWAHYADEHNGICIGFKKDLFESQKKAGPTINNIESYIPQKIDYDSIRPENIESMANSRDEIRHQARRQLLTKSDDWIYEKEHRCILPMKWADQLRLVDKKDERLFELDYINDGLLDEIDDDLFEGEGVSHLAENLFRLKEKAFLKKVNISSVVSIHLGCKMKKYEEDLLVDTFSQENSPFGHIKLYKCQPSKNRFELKVTQIFPKNNSQINEIP
ncbi:TPA: DUF2971 domain-containing protein [Aeromonas sobria]|nr:DUF2971 domain-containing protein [Aeromonas sobria]